MRGKTTWRTQPKAWQQSSSHEGPYKKRKEKRSKRLSAAGSADILYIIIYVFLGCCAQSSRTTPPTTGGQPCQGPSHCQIYKKKQVCLQALQLLLEVADNLMARKGQSKPIWVDWLRYLITVTFHAFQEWYVAVVPKSNLCRQASERLHQSASTHGSELEIMSEFKKLNSRESHWALNSQRRIGFAFILYVRMWHFPSPHPTESCAS